MKLFQFQLLMVCFRCVYFFAIGLQISLQEPVDIGKTRKINYLLMSKGEIKIEC